MRGRSDTPLPPRDGNGIRRRSLSPRGRFGGRDDREYPTDLIVRNLRHDCSLDDLRLAFGAFGPLEDVYIPRNYYTGQPRGFGFVKFVDHVDAAEAKYQLDGKYILGRELKVLFSEGNRMKPADMKARYHVSGRSYDRRISPHSLQYSRSPAQHLGRGRSGSRGYSSSRRRREYSRSNSRECRRTSRERSRSIPRSIREKSYSRSPARSESRFRSQNPGEGSADRSHVEEDTKEPSRERSSSR